MNNFRSINKMNFDNLLLKKLLLDKCGALDLDGSEQMLIDICAHDLYLYILWCMESTPVTDILFLEYFTTFVLHYDLEVEHEVQPILTNELITKYENDSEEYAKILISGWWKKFMERVAVKPTRSKEEMQMATTFLPTSHIFNPDEMNELYHYVATILLRNGERCFLRPMMDNILSMTLSRANKSGYKLEDKLNLMQAVGAEAKRLISKSGPIMFVYPTYGKLNFRAREFRGDDTVGKVL